MGAKFEKVKRYEDSDFQLPERKTVYSAGYDFEVIEDIVIPSMYVQIFNLLKSKIASTEFLSDLGDLKIVKILAELGENIPQMSATAKQDIVKVLIEQEMPSVINFIRDEMTISLNDMRDLTKRANSRMTLVPTGVKVKLEDNQKLELMIRSSSSMGAYLMLANGVGLIDADYYNNEDNEGHIFFQVINMSPFNIKLEKGNIIGQGVISTYDKTEDDNSTDLRVGGLGSSTTKK